jgi:GBP family porin
MKKTLLAAALLTGYAGAAMAQNSVTLYGVVDLGLAYQNIKPGQAAPTIDSRSQVGMASGQQAGSRWGIRGVEDLGNGLKANFVYEQGINAQNGSIGVGDGFARQSTLGLASDSWGAIDLGRRTAPSTAAFSGVDPFAAGFGTGALTTTIGTNFYRLSNMVMYSSPSISGFRAMVGYSFDTGLSTTPAAAGSSQFGQANKSRAVSVGLRYANGPLLLAATYDNIQANSRSTGAVVRDDEKFVAASAGYTPPSSSFKTWALGGTYDLKAVKIHAAYSQGIDGILNNSTTIRSVGTGGDTNAGSNVIFRPGARTQSWMVGLSAPVGTGNVFASVQQQLPGGNLNETAVQTANELSASIGYTYPFSNRTNLYAYYSYMNNAAMVKDATANTVGLGIRHQF